MIEQKDADIFWQKVEKKNENECWEWLGTKTPRGYGHFWLNGKKIYAHRSSWYLHNGKIPAGMCICHHCDNPSCVNPAHLFLGTQRDNALDAMKKNRLVFPLGEDNGKSKLTEKDVLAIRAEYQPRGKNNQRVLAKKYGVCRMNISHVVNREIWKHI